MSSLDGIGGEHRANTKLTSSALHMFAWALNLRRNFATKPRRDTVLANVFELT